MNIFKTADNFSNSESLCPSNASNQDLAQLDHDGLGGDVVGRISRWPPWWPAWITEWNNFSNSESLCHCDASHQVLAQSNLPFGRCHLKNFKMTIVAILDIRTEQL